MKIINTSQAEKQITTAIKKIVRQFVAFKFILSTPDNLSLEFLPLFFIIVLLFAVVNKYLSKNNKYLLISIENNDDKIKNE